MSLVLVTAPAAEVLTLAQVKKQLRITSTVDDDLLTAMIIAIRQTLEGRDGWLGRVLVQQTWDWKLDNFDGQLEIPLPPLRSISSIKYLDGAGALQTLDPSIYQVVGADGGWKGSVVPAYGKSWPTTFAQPESVTIRFVAGYEPGEGVGKEADNVPAPIKQAMLLMIRDLYSLGERNLFLSSETIDGVITRQYVVSPNAAAVMRAASDALLSPYRVWSVA